MAQILLSSIKQCGKLVDLRPANGFYSERIMKFGKQR